MDPILGYMMSFVRWAMILVLSALYPGVYTPWVGKVVEIVRADEIKVERNHKIVAVRLYGIDAPISFGKESAVQPKLAGEHIQQQADRDKETHVGMPTSQNYGQTAKNYLSNRILNKPVLIQPLPGAIKGPWYRPTIRPYDRFNRIQALVRLYGQEGESLNEELLKKGLAWWYSPFVPFERGFKHLEDRARQAKVGLWAQTNPIPPWRWQGTRLLKDNPLQKRGTMIYYAAGFAALVAMLALIVGFVRTVIRRFSSRGSS